NATEISVAPGSSAGLSLVLTPPIAPGSSVTLSVAVSGGGSSLAISGLPSGAFTRAAGQETIQLTLQAGSGFNTDVTLTFTPSGVTSPDRVYQGATIPPVTVTVHAIGGQSDPLVSRCLL